MSFFDFLAANRAQMLTRTLEHLGLVGLSVLIAVSVGVPLGIMITRRAGLRGPVLGFANVFQTIPSLALFGFLIPLPLLGGIGARSAVVALVVYALLPIVRNTYTGISEVDGAVTEAARGMGMTDHEILRMVELPLAAPVILAGIRIATVVGVGVATIAAAIGAGGLGVFIFQGLARVDTVTIMAGAVPAALMALALDGGLHLLERRLDWKRK